MFCSTECWDCEDRTCEHYICKSKLYFENNQLKDRIEKAIEYIEKYTNSILNEFDYISTSPKTLLKILKGEEKD